MEAKQTETIPTEIEELRQRNPPTQGIVPHSSLGSGTPDLSLALDCVADAGEREVYLHCRHDHRCPDGAAFVCGGANRTSEHLDIGQQFRERLIEPEVIHWPGDLAVLDEKCAMSPVNEIIRGFRERMYQKRVINRPCLTDLIMSSREAPLPAMIKFDGFALGSTPCFGEFNDAFLTPPLRAIMDQHLTVMRGTNETNPSGVGSRRSYPNSIGLTSRPEPLRPGAR